MTNGINNLAAINLHYGSYAGCGFMSKEEAMDTVDFDLPNLGERYLICGEFYTLEMIDQKLEFVKERL